MTSASLGARHVPGTCCALQIDAQRRMERVTGMLTRNRHYGSFMSTSRSVLRQVAQKLGLRQLANTA